MKVIKRDGRAVEYNSNKIFVAIEKANNDVTEDKRTTEEEINHIIEYIESLDKKRILVEDIQDIIEQKLMELGKYELAKQYIVYRYTRALVRKQNTTDESILGLIKNGGNVFQNSERNSMMACVQRNLIAGEVSKDLTKRILLPEKITKAHEDGILYFHDMEYFLQPIINSSLINLGDMLDNGTCINNYNIDTPNGFLEACMIFSQIIQAVSNSQYGKIYVDVKHLGKYLRKSTKNIIENEENIIGKNSLESHKKQQEIVDNKVEKELEQGIKIIKYQINGLINMSGNNHIVSLIMINDSENEYYEEIEMIINEIKKQNIENCDIITDKQEIPEYQYEGHFNYGIVSINLLKIVKDLLKNNFENSNKEEIDKNKLENNFWKMLDDRLELCYEALMCRHYALLGTMSDSSPIHWQYGAISRIEKGEKIDKLLKDGYSDICLNYTDFDETINIMSENLEMDKSYEEKFKNKLSKNLENKVQNWRKMTGLGFTLKKDI